MSCLHACTRCAHKIKIMSYTQDAHLLPSLKRQELDDTHSGLRPTGHLQTYLNSPLRAPELPWPGWKTPELERASVRPCRDTRKTT